MRVVMRPYGDSWVRRLDLGSRCPSEEDLPVAVYMWGSCKPLALQEDFSVRIQLNNGLRTTQCMRLLEYIAIWI